MVEAVERLRKTEGVFGHDGEFQGANRLFDDFVEASGLEHQAPELVGFLVIGRQHGRGQRGNTRDDVGSREPVAFLHLVEDVVRAHHRVLKVRAALALEAQRLVYVEAMTLPRENLTMK